ncbi:MAG: tetratricopeptide repeat protein [Nostoc sp.]|uniref:tetratricopeptide repeat protein n=1 Tax=unclassified Nostoc TaxID=2593658 RepID=UPI002AD31DB7|nr:MULTISPECIES: tetratricopeptide repeat protein [unclassified Nostoc]MDZ8035968.1 tetratricopeptide repeat protein [Nostoc sp. DedSLP04]MDZ8069584.1 tetratricopeptide repeat protein [Nostoc sp. DedQUE08]MDZ8096073.1 tetratricopeptide repeat protein [Nostoc sp. DedQUE05]
MLETFPTSSILAAVVVVLSLSILGYFAWKTLITSDLFQKGINLAQAKDYQGAEAAFRKVISINSTNDVVRLFLGDVLNQQGQVEEATELFREVIRRSPKNPDAYLRLANILMQQEREEEAKTNLQQAKDLLQKQRQPEKAKKITQLLDKMSAKSSES